MATLTYRIDGPQGAPLLVLSNSLGTTWDMWNPQVSTFRQHFRILRYDHRGHGQTPASTGPYTIGDLAGDVLELLDGIGEQRASFCGLSLGGMVVMWIASHAPERVDRIVLACTSPALGPAAPWTERAAAVRASGTGILLGALLGRWFTAGFPERRPDVASAIAEMLSAADPESYAACCEAIGAMDQTADLAAIVAPTLIIAGATDPVTPPAAAVALQERVSGSSLLVLAGAAHLANIEQPESFTAAVVDHLIGTAFDRGSRTRREVLGDAHVDRSEADRTDFTSGFQDLITRYAWGEIWSRPGLDRPSRSCITLATLVALGRFDELALHIRAARRNGVSDDQIGEVLLQSAIYCGVPAANAAFAVAKRVLEDQPEG